MVEWRISDTPVAYGKALEAMQARVEAIRNREADELIWLLEHPPLYTAGTSARAQDLLDPDRFDVIQTGRGGQYTYHGPGQRVVYVMLDLERRGRDVRAFVRALERWTKAVLWSFHVKGHSREGRVGIWIERPEKPRLPDGSLHEDKIAAVGIRVRKWVSFHGLAINVDPDLSHFEGIVPCGVTGHGVTSLIDLGLPISMASVDSALMAEFEASFASA